MSAKVNRIATLHTGRVFRLDRENITLENGATVDIDIIRHPGASAVVPMRDPQTVVLIRQYRHAAGGTIWEIPAGTLQAGEAPLACAKRELAEETGLWADSWWKLGETVPVPGYSDERIHLFLAASLFPAKQNLDEDEVIEVHNIPFDDALDMVYSGLILDAKTISGLFLARNLLTTIVK